MSRPKRLTIAALVLLVLGGGLWWSIRPKIDPRFLGKWRITEGEFIGAKRDLDFRSGGIIDSDVIFNGGGLEWSVGGNRLRLEVYEFDKPRPNLTWKQLSNLWWYATARLRGIQSNATLESLLHDVTYEIMMLDESRMELRLGEPFEKVVLQRVRG